jgi:hypothetical protein
MNLSADGCLLETKSDPLEALIDPGLAKPYAQGVTLK